MRNNYENTKFLDKAREINLLSAADVFPVESVDASGIFKLSGNRYSKQYSLSDVNFLGLTEDEQKQMIIAYSKVLKSIPCRFSLTVANVYEDQMNLENKVKYEGADDELDFLRKAFEEVVIEKTKDAKKGLAQSLYLTLTVEEASIYEAKQSFMSMEASIRSAFIGIGRNGGHGSVLKPLSLNQRMQLFYDFTHIGIESKYRFDYAKETKNLHCWQSITSPARLEFYSEHFEINNHVGKVMYIDSYPNTLESDIICTLSKLNCTCYISINNELIDASSFKQEYSRKYMSVGMKIESEKKRNRDNNDFLADASTKLLNQKKELDNFAKEIDEEDEHYFNTTILLMVIAKDEEELQKIMDKVESICGLKSITMDSCFAKQKEGVNSTFPFGAQEFKHVVNLSSSCLAMFMPFKTQELWDLSGIYYGINQISQNVIYANKKKLKNHNGLFLGQSGAGKSMYAKEEMIQILIKEILDRIIVIDPQGEYKDFAKEIKGCVIKFDSTQETYLNPMDIDFTDVEISELREIISDKTDFILSLISICLKRDLTATEQGIIDSVVERVYTENYSFRKGLSGELSLANVEMPAVFNKRKPSQIENTNISVEDEIRRYSPILQDVYQGLLEHEKEEAKSLAGAMEIFVNGSLNLFNHRTNVNLDNRFIVFDISSMKDNLRICCMLIMMETVRSSIKQNALSSRFTHLYIDEFHELLAIEAVAEFVLKLWKEIRKMSGVINGITQNMSDLLENDVGGKLGAILSNTEFFALMSQSSLDKEKIIQFKPGISKAMFNYVDNAEPGCGLLIMGNSAIAFDSVMGEDNLIYRLINTDGGGYAV